MGTEGGQVGPFPPGLVRSTVLVAQLRSGEVVRSAGWAERCNLTEGSCRYLAWRPRTWGLASSQRDLHLLGKACASWSLHTQS